MLTLLPQTTDVHLCQFSFLAALLVEPLPRTPEDLWQLPQRLSTAAGQVADQMGLVQVPRAQNDEAWVRQAMAHARAQSPGRLVPQGVRTTSGLLLGGTRLLVETPALRADRRGRRGRRRHKRGPHGAGCSPVLQALGRADRVRPATGSAIALHVGQAASDREAVELLARRGLACDVSHLVRISTAPAETRTRRRAAALVSALRLPSAPAGPLAGQRVRTSLAGGRVRPRRWRRGRKTAKRRHGLTTPWREPRMRGLDLLEAQGQPDRPRVPLYAGLIGDAAAVCALLIGAVRRLGAAARCGGSVRPMRTW